MTDKKAEDNFSDFSLFTHDNPAEIIEKLTNIRNKIH